MEGFKAPLWDNVYKEESRHTRWKRGDDVKYMVTFHCLVCHRHGFPDRMQHDLEFQHNTYRDGQLHRDPLGVMLEIVDCLWGDVVKSH